MKTKSEIDNLRRMLETLAAHPKVRQSASTVMFGAVSALEWVIERKETDAAEYVIAEWTETAKRLGIAE